MADRYDFDRDRERDFDQEHDRETDRGHRHEMREFGGDRNRDYGHRGMNRQDDWERSGSPRWSEGDRGDWGRQGSWGTYGNHPDFAHESGYHQGGQRRSPSKCPE
jgi:hypothetical protein